MPLSCCVVQQPQNFGTNTYSTRPTLTSKRKEGNQCRRHCHLRRGKNKRIAVNQRITCVELDNVRLARTICVLRQTTNQTQCPTCCSTNSSTVVNDPRRNARLNTYACMHSSHLFVTALRGCQCQKTSIKNEAAPPVGRRWWPAPLLALPSEETAGRKGSSSTRGPTVAELSGVHHSSKTQKEKGAHFEQTARQTVARNSSSVEE